MGNGQGPGKGNTNNPKGRVKGVPNRATTEFKEALNNLLKTAAPEMIRWLEQVSKEDPAKALDLVCKLAEYCYPKLARSENINREATYEDFLETLEKENDDI